MEDRNKRYGINVKKWCREHEQYVEAAIKDTSSPEDIARILALHEKKLSWLMHERLIHLIVLFITVIITLFALLLVLLMPDTMPASLVMFLITFVLLCFYVRHYFFLENTVQKWYGLYEDIIGRS